MTILSHISLITIYFNQMLNWCQNTTHHDDQSEIHFTPSLSQPQYSNRTQPPPKFAINSHNNYQTRRIKPQARKGIKTHFDRSGKMDKSIQVILPYNVPKILIDSATQTGRIGVQLVHSQLRSHKFNYSLQVSPKSHNRNPNLFRFEKFKQANQQSQNVPKYIDYTSEQNKQTKATYCLADTKDNIIFDKRSKFYQVFEVESYHQRATNQSQLRQEHNKKIIRFDRVPKQDAPLSSLQKTQSEDESHLIYSNKYHQMLKNVESEFKMSQKKQSQKKFKETPPKRFLLNERQTIVSKYGHQRRDSQRSLLIQQSILYQPQIRSYFTPLSQIYEHHDYTLYLAKENLIGILVSIKQITIQHMNRISEQLLMYKQLEPHADKAEGILNLYQTQIDRSCYMLIKEPFTQTILEYIKNGGNLTDVSKQIQVILHNMQKLGFSLREWPRIENMVVCVRRVKIQSVSIFTLDNNFRGIQIQQAVEMVRQEILQNVF